MVEVICDTSPLQYLHQLGLLDLLRDLVGSIVVPDSVAEELQQGHQLGVSVPSIGELPWVEVRVPKGATVLRLIRDLDAGEAGALALALESPGSVVLLDDRLGRRVAASLGIPIRGTVGLLVDFKRRGLIAAVAPHFPLFEIDRLIVTQQPVPMELLWKCPGYALMYTVVMLGFGWLIFNEREF